MRPKVSEKTYARRRMFPLCAPGVGPNCAEWDDFQQLLWDGDTAGAQRMMLGVLERQRRLIFHGPDFRVAMRGGRKRLVMK